MYDLKTEGVCIKKFFNMNLGVSLRTPPVSHLTSCFFITTTALI